MYLNPTFELTFTERLAQIFDDFIVMLADIFTDAGEELAANQMDSNTAAAITNWYVAQGTGAGTAAKANTTLFTEATEARVATTDSQPAANQNRYVGTITADGTKTVTNAGIFDASTGGNILLKSDFTGIGVDAGDSIQFTFTVTWS